MATAPGRLLWLAVAAVLLATASWAASPNIVIFLTDDQGYGDLSVAGHPTIRTPNIDALALGGVRFTQFMAANAVCTPTRAALLTGRLPVRTGMTGTLFQTMWSAAQATGLPHEELTIAEALKAHDPTYRAAMVGKWHLGINQNTSTDGYFLPEAHGFDSSFTFPVSNNPSCAVDVGNRTWTFADMCFIMRGNVVVEQPVSLATLPDRFADEAIAFVTENGAAGRPYFLYYAFPQPHTPLFASERFLGRSRRGLYGDVVEEVDDAVGRVMAAIRATGQENNTLVIFSSDNGAWLEELALGGSNGLLRGGKGQDWEGGVRVPGIVWGPGLGVKAGVISHALASTMDVFPTVLDVVGAPPADVFVDGRSLEGVLRGTEDDAATADSRALFHYCGYLLHAVRVGPWKAHYATPQLGDPVENTCTIGIGNIRVCFCLDVFSNFHDPPLLYNVDEDPSERFLRDPATDPAAAAALDRVQQALAAHLAELVPAPTQVDTRPYPELQPCCNPPLCRCTESPPHRQRAAA